MRLAALLRLVCISLVIMASNARAAFIDFKTPADLQSGGQWVDADVQFTTSKNVITIVLSNLQTNVGSILQTLRGVEFTLNNNLTKATLTSSSDAQRTITKTGTWSDAKTAISTGWSISNSAGTFDLKSPGDSNTAHTSLIGLPDASSNHYANDTGIYFAPTATFTISCAGVSSGTTISNATFTFGNGAQAPSALIGATSVPLPEPASLSLLALAAVPLLSRRRIA